MFAIGFRIFFLSAGSPPATGTGTILVTVEDINDNPPIATSLLNRVCNQNGLPVNVTIVDKDIPPNTFPYAIALVHGAENNWTIESTSRGKFITFQTELLTNKYFNPLSSTTSLSLSAALLLARYTCISRKLNAEMWEP